MKKIIFTGAQGTGKSTILNYFKENGYPVITEVVRTLAQEGIKINEEGTIRSQEIIFDTYKQIFSNCENVMLENVVFSDRGLTDVASYTAYLAIAEHNFDAMKLLIQELEEIREWNEKNDVVYFYFPIEFPVVDDGVRSTNEKYRKFINDYIKFVLDYLKVDYHTVTGTVEERIMFIENYLIS